MKSVRMLLSIAMLAAVCAGQFAAAAGERKAAPAFTLADANAKPVRLADYKGKVVLLDFWATWCTGCKVEIPWYMEFQAEYKDRGLAAIGVAMDEDGWKKVAPYVAEHPITYTIVVGDAAFAMRYEITSLPVTLLIDRKGMIAEKHVGMVDRSAFEAEIQQLLRERE